MNKTTETGRIGQNRYGNGGGGSIFFEEFLPELRGIKGVQAYNEMADNDSTVGAILFAIEMLMRQCEFHIQPGGNKEKDIEAAEFIESCMNDMERSWADTLSEILSFLTYGWSYHEIVYKRRNGKGTSPMTNSKYNDGLIGWRKLPIRSQDTLCGWEYKGETDELIGMMQTPPPNYERITIPIEKALHFRTRSRKDNPEGRSILRTAYRDWYFKKRLQEIEAYGIERDLAGFPVLYTPAEMDIWNQEDPEMRQTLARAEMIVSSIRRDAREGLVIPGGENGWKLELLASGSRRQFDTNAILERYDKRIATSVLADFVMLGQQQVGSFALADSKTKIFSLAIGTYLDVICGVFNGQAIPRLIDVNGNYFQGITDYPKMVHGDIEDRDLAAFATYIKDMVGIGVLTPDEELEKEIRRVAGLPEKIVNSDDYGLLGTSNTDEVESGSIYKITSVLEKYRGGKITRDTAANLFAGIGLDAEKIDFYLKEADSAMDADVKDEVAAKEAKKSLGRTTKAGEKVSFWRRIWKFNPYHDRAGRFASADGGSGTGAASKEFPYGKTYNKDGELTLDKKSREKYTEILTQITTSDGVRINTVGDHTFDRAAQREILPEEIADCLVDTSVTFPGKEDPRGPSTAYQKGDIRVLVNIKTGKMMTIMWRTDK